MAFLEFFDIVEDVAEGGLDLWSEGGVIAFAGGGFEGEDEPVELVAEGEAEAGLVEFFAFAAFPFAEVLAAAVLVLEIDLFDAFEVEFEGGGIAGEGGAVGADGGAEAGVDFGVGVGLEFVEALEEGLAVDVFQCFSLDGGGENQG